MKSAKLQDYLISDLRVQTKDVLSTFTHGGEGSRAVPETISYTYMLFCSPHMVTLARRSSPTEGASETASPQRQGGGNRPPPKE